MGDTLIGLRQPLGGTCTVGPLPKYGRVAFTIRLKCHAFAIRGPNRIMIRSSDRELARRNCASEIINPDIAIAFKGDSLSVRRGSNQTVCARRSFEHLNGALTIDKSEQKSLISDNRGCWSRKIDQRSGVGEAELRRAQTSHTNALDNRNGTAGNLQ